MSLQVAATLTTSLALWETRAGTIQLSHPGTPALRHFRALNICCAESARLGLLGIWEQMMMRKPRQVSNILRVNPLPSKQGHYSCESSLRE